MTGADLIASLKKHPIGLGCGLITIVCAVVLYSRAGNISASQTELEARTAEANKMIANVRNSVGLPEQVTELQAERKELESRLLKAGQLAVNLQYFYKLEAETEVKLTGDVRQSAPGRPKGAYVGVPFAVAVQGNYPQLMNFLSKVQNGRHFCRVSAVTLSKSGNSSEARSGPGGDMTMALNLDLLGQP